MSSVVTAEDRVHLKVALELAEGGRGRVSPNPMVGAVLVRDGETIGTGFHARLGELHAERAAVEDCRTRGEDPTGATMYVTLEPCAHQGSQPPCTAAIVEAGIGTALADDPLLTAREVGAERQPARVVFDSTVRLPPDSRLVTSIATAPLIVVAGLDAPAPRVEALRGAGADVLKLGGGRAEVVR